MAEHKHNEEGATRAAPARPGAERAQASAEAPHPAALLRGGGRGPLAPPHVLGLQRAVGNRATGRLLGRKNSPPVQTKLVVSPAGDAFEQEADRVAREVVSELGASPPPSVQRLAEDDEEREGRVQREFDASLADIDADGGAVPPDVERRLEQGRGGGRPLESGLRARLEQSFGADFGGVRVHTGEQAEALNASLGARAFTTGQDIFFGPGEYAPASRAGQEVLAHELTHVVQQNPSVSARGHAPADGKATPRVASLPISAVAGQRLQLLRTGTEMKSLETMDEALSDLKKIKKPSQISETFEDLDEDEPGVLARYKSDYENVYLPGVKMGDMFQWPLTYLRGRAARKRGKNSESTVIYNVYGASKNNATFYVQQDADDDDIDTFAARIPDVFISDTVADVKNVKYQSFDAQMADFYIIAKGKDYISGEKRKVYESDKETLVTDKRDFEVVLRSSDHPEGKSEVSGTLEAAADRVRYKID